MSKIDKIHRAIASGKTILGVGPMSWSCIDAVIEVANEHRIPIQLIASRRQVECEELGGGYVTDTRTLAQYVKEKDEGEYVFLARDHGGPYQGSGNWDEIVTEFAYADLSYEKDIENGFDILHIDPSLIPDRSMEKILEDIDYLYYICESYAKQQNRELIYEVGTEEHGGGITQPDDFHKFVQKMKQYPKVKFVVGNTGLYVKETSNVGCFDRESTKKMLKSCNDAGFYFKAHNSDYISDMGLSLMNEMGIHSMNVAPQYGVRETQMWLEGMESQELKDRFVKMAIDSGKWKKWMITDLSYYEDPKYDIHKAAIAGHYIINDFVKSLSNTPRWRGLIETFQSAIKVGLKDLLRYQLGRLGWNTSGEARKWT